VREIDETNVENIAARALEQDADDHIRRDDIPSVPSDTLPKPPVRASKVFR
jgi:hypothetical protein